MDEDSILLELVRLSQLYAKNSSNKLIIKCTDSDGNSVMKFSSGATIHKSERTVRKPWLVSANSVNLRATVREKLLERVRADLKDPDWDHVPWSRLEANGWPANVPYPLKVASKIQAEAVLAALKSGKLHFKMMSSEDDECTDSEDENDNFSETSEAEFANEKGKKPTALYLRHRLLEKVRADLNEPDLQLIPWTRLEADGWPKGVTWRFYSPTQAEISMIDRCLESGILKFRAKEKSSSGSESDVDAGSEFDQQQMTSLGFVQ